jgi:hypothetical protein
MVYLLAPDFSASDLIASVSEKLPRRLRLST